LRTAWPEVVVEMAEIVAEKGGRIAADTIFFEMVTSTESHTASKK
jgi:hypothetical protein